MGKQKQNLLFLFYSSSSFLHSRFFSVILFANGKNTSTHYWHICVWKTQNTFIPHRLLNSAFTRCARLLLLLVVFFLRFTYSNSSHSIAHKHRHAQKIDTPVCRSVESTLSLLAGYLLLCSLFFAL